MCISSIIGCTHKSTYKIDFAGEESMFFTENKASFFSGKTHLIPCKTKYRAGEEVVLYYPYIATDTNYEFFLDGEAISPGYEDGKGYIIRFMMPNHDVKIGCHSYNSMTL